MASSFKSSFQRGSDIEYDYCCTRCEEDNKNAEALFYCTSCCKLFCDPCVKLHGTYFKGHDVLGQKQVKKWGPVRRDVAMAMCDEHKGEDLKMYCMDHGRVCCTVCVSSYHRSCKNVQHVPKVAKGIRQTKEFKKLPSEVSNMIKELDNIQDKSMKNHQVLLDICKKITTSLQELRKKLTKIMDKIEKRTIEQMDELFATMDGDIQSNIDTCKVMKDELKKLIDVVKTKGEKSDTFAFTGLKKCQDKLSHAEGLASSTTKQDYTLTFTPDTSIEQCLSTMETFGKFTASTNISTTASSPVKTDHVYTKTDHDYTTSPVKTDHVYTKTDHDYTTSPVKTDHVYTKTDHVYTTSPVKTDHVYTKTDHVYTTSPVKTDHVYTKTDHVYTTSPVKTDHVYTTSPVKTDHVYSMVKKKQYNVKMKSDKRECYITGCCTLPNGNTVIVDWNNSKVKLLNQKYSVLSHYDIPSFLQDICHIADCEVAVAVWGNSGPEIQFINTDTGKLSLTRCIKLDHDCRGIAHHAGQLYVGSGTALYIYTMAGQLVKKLYEDPSGSYTVWRFAVSDDGRKIYITDHSHNTLITLDNTGNKLATLGHPDLWGPTGVQVANYGSVLLCNYNPHAVMQVAADGKRMLATLVTKTDGVENSLSLCLDRKTSTLIVGQNNDNILVLKIK